VTCLFVFPERDPSLFFPIVNLNTNVCVEAVVGKMKPHHVSHVKGGPQAVPSTTLYPPTPTWFRTCCVFHLEPTVALTVFIFVITRPFLVFGVFVGLFMGLHRHDFFLGGSFWRNRAILRLF
jgi:hypothetical protein